MYKARQLINSCIIDIKRNVFSLESKVKSLGQALKVLRSSKNKSANKALKEERRILTLEIKDLNSLSFHLQRFES